MPRRCAIPLPKRAESAARSQVAFARRIGNGAFGSRVVCPTISREQLTRMHLPPPPFWRTRYYEATRSKAGRAAIDYNDVAAVLAAPFRTERRADGRVRFWGWVPRLRRWLRVVTLEDGSTVHNAFLDRRFKP